MAEETEPLMSGQLYDTLRRVRQQKVEDALDVTRTMLDRGILDQARAAESQAGQGIEQLKQGVEKAAESVLGDENEALRRAHEALTDLADQLNEEMLRQGQPGGRRDSGRPGDLQRFVPSQPQPRGPIAGNDFVPWSDQLRDVEEMMEDPELRAEAARIRDRARAVRRQSRGGLSKNGPNWDLVREFIAEPLCELRDRVAEELLRRGGGQTMVPIDRDPVPPKYTEQVRRYYERLGRGQ